MWNSGNLGNIEYNVLFIQTFIIAVHFVNKWGYTLKNKNHIVLDYLKAKLQMFHMIVQ